MTTKLAWRICLLARQLTLTQERNRASRPGEDSHGSVVVLLHCILNGREEDTRSCSSHEGRHSIAKHRLLLVLCWLSAEVGGLWVIFVCHVVYGYGGMTRGTQAGLIGLCQLLPRIRDAV